MNRSFPSRLAALAVAVAFVCHLALAADAESKPPATERSLPPYLVEWVYRVKWGDSDEFWRLFRKNQIPLLDKEKQLGRVLNYTVYRPGLHTSEDQRWDYRVVITYRDIVATTQSHDLPKQLFPDQAAFKREENQRWSITVAHYDLPIREEVDPHSDGD